MEQEYIKVIVCGATVYSNHGNAQTRISYAKIAGDSV